MSIDVNSMLIELIILIHVVHLVIDDLMLLVLLAFFVVQARVVIYHLLNLFNVLLLLADMATSFKVGDWSTQLVFLGKLLSSLSFVDFLWRAKRLLWATCVHSGWTEERLWLILQHSLFLL